MTPEERSILTDFLKDLERFRGTAKDAEAAGLIDEALRRNPDAGYVLVQHAIVANRALQEASARIKELEAVAKGARDQSSFLGASPLLDRPSGPWGAVASPGGTYASSAAPPAAQPLRQGGGVGSFLGSIAQTAAGVAGGALLFEGLSSLFGGGHYGGWGWGVPQWGQTAYADADDRLVDGNEGVAGQADFTSVDDQMSGADDQIADLGGDFGSADDSV